MEVLVVKTRQFTPFNVLRKLRVEKLQLHFIVREGGGKLGEDPRTGGWVDFKEEEARQLRGEAEDLKQKARLEDLSVYTVEKVKPTAKGEARTYTYWYASWWVGDRARNVYLGSVARLSEEAALAKARTMKAEALGLDL